MITLLHSFFIDQNIIDFYPDSELTEIIQNVKTICSTLKGTVPLDRSFGIPADIIDAPTPIAQARYTAEVLKAIKLYEPRAKVKRIQFQKVNPEKLAPVITIETR